jgi:hypothetical protein
MKTTSTTNMSINPDETSEKFIAHVNARVERAKDPKNTLSLDDFFADIDKKYTAKKNGGKTT